MVAYQNEAYAKGYERFLQLVVTRGGPKAPGYEHAVAKNLYTLMAYKDEYEVARQHSNGSLIKLIAEQFDGDYTLRFSLAPLLFARKRAKGLPRKKLYGSWMQHAFGILARLKFLRGTAIDPFGFTDERQTERALIPLPSNYGSGVWPRTPLRVQRCPASCGRGQQMRCSCLSR